MNVFFVDAARGRWAAMKSLCVLAGRQDLWNTIEKIEKAELAPLTLRAYRGSAKAQIAFVVAHNMDPLAAENLLLFLLQKFDVCGPSVLRTAIAAFMVCVF